MPRAEEADESKTEDEYIPGNSPTLSLLLESMLEGFVGHVMLHESLSVWALTCFILLTELYFSIAYSLDVHTCLGLV